jgi:prolyl-tRNA synthetase
MAKALLTPREVDFPRWYQDVIAKAELAENGPARGSMVIRPTGYALWERMQRELDDRIKAAGAANAYFPHLARITTSHDHELSRGVCTAEPDAPRAVGRGTGQPAGGHPRE